MTDDQVRALATVVSTRHALETAIADHDEAVHAALRAGISLRVVGASAAASYRTLARQREAREAEERSLRRVK